MRRKSISQYRRSLSEKESNVLSDLSYNGKHIFSIDDLKELVDNPKNVLDKLVRKKWLLKIKKGTYAIAPFEAGVLGAESYTLHSFVIASLLIKPYYIGYWSALNYYGLTDQTPSIVYVVSTKPKNSCEILNTVFKFVKTVPHKMFGVENIDVEKRKIIVSSKEKTIVDCLDHPEHCGGVEEIAKILYFYFDEIDIKKVVVYAKKIGNSAVLKRLGYLFETLKLSHSELLNDVKLGEGYSLLDPTLPKVGRIVERWKLVLNISIDYSRWTR